MEQNKPSAKTSRTSLGRRVLRIAVFTLLGLIALLVIVAYSLTLPAVQQRITKEAESFLNEKLKTRVEIGSIRVVFPYNVSLKQFLIEDRAGDTLARVGSLVVNLNMMKLLDRTISVEGIELEAASVRLLRRDSVFNFKFIADAFSDPAKPRATVSDTTKSPWKLQVSPTEVDLKNVSFRLRDEDADALTSARVGQAELVISRADIDKLDFNIDRFTLADSEIQLVTTKKDDDDDDDDAGTSFRAVVDRADIQRSRILVSSPELYLDARLNATKIENATIASVDDAVAIAVENVELENNDIVYRDPDQPPTPGHFNAGDMEMRALTGRLYNFSMRNDSITAFTEDLTALEKSGLTVHKISADLFITPRSINIKNADVHVNRTLVQGDIALVRADTGATFNRMDVQLRQARGVTSDLEKLLQPTKGGKSPFAGLGDMPYEASGQLRGWLDNLYASNFRLRAGNGTTVHVNGALQNLDRPDRLGANLTVHNLESTREDLMRFMTMSGQTSRAKALDTPLPEWVRVSGNINGGLANVRVDLRGQAGPLQRATHAPVRSGPLNFNVAGTVRNATDPDRLAMDLTLRDVNGPGAFFDAATPPTIRMSDQISTSGTLRGTLASLATNLKISSLRDGARSELAVNGTAQHLLDPRRVGFDGTINGEVSRGDILGYGPGDKIDAKLDLPAAVQLDGKFTGTRQRMAADVEVGLNGLGKLFIDGTLEDSVYQADIVAQNLQLGRLTRDSATAPISSLGLRIHAVGHGFDFMNTAAVKADGQLDSVIYGNNILRDISFAGDLDGKLFNATLNSPDERLALRANISGDFGRAAPYLKTDISVNCADLRSFGWTHRPTTVCFRVRSESEGLSLDTLLAKMTIEKIDLQYDTVHVKPGDLSLDIKLLNQQNDVTITSDWLNGELRGHFSIPAIGKTVGGIVEKYFIVDRSVAYVPPVGDDSLYLRLNLTEPELLTTGLIPGLIDLRPVAFLLSLNEATGNLALEARTPYLRYRDWAIDSLTADAFAGDTAAQFAITTNEVRRLDKPFVIEADLSGNFRANRARIEFFARDREKRERYHMFADANILPGRGGMQVMLERELVVDYHAWDVAPGNRITIAPTGIEVRDLSLSGNGQSIDIEGATRKLAGGASSVEFDIDVGRLNIDNFDLFFDKWLEESEGWMAADINVRGTTEALKVGGQVSFHETEITPVQTQVRYRLSETPLVFNADGLEVNKLTLTDPRNHTLTIDGRLLTTDWQNIRSQLTFSGTNFQALATTIRHNPNLFGTVFIDLNGRIWGLLPQPNVFVNIRTADESEITYVNEASSRQADAEGVVKFLEPARKYLRPPVYDNEEGDAGVYVNAKIDLDSTLVFRVVVDPVTGDDFAGSAIGQLQIEVFPESPTTVVGRVEVVRGLYNFSYQSIIQREFQVVPGSFVLFTGDPRFPEIQARARHVFDAAPYPLVANQLAGVPEAEASEYRQRQTFYLQSTINGTPQEPNVGFTFIYPPDANENATLNFRNSEIGLVRTAIGSVNSDPNLLSRQVFGVLLLRNFIGESVGPSLAISGGGGSGRPFQAGLSEFLTTQVNALADQYLSFIDIDLAVRDNLQTTGAGGEAEPTTTYQLRLQKGFFDDRLIFRLSSATTTSAGEDDEVHSSLENASVEYAVTPKGWLRLTTFSRQGYELLNASTPNLRNNGAGVLISKEFNHWFRRHEHEEEPAPVADTSTIRK